MFSGKAERERERKSLSTSLYSFLSLFLCVFFVRVCVFVYVHVLPGWDGSPPSGVWLRLLCLGEFPSDVFFGDLIHVYQSVRLH